MTAENSWHLLQQAKEERVEPVLALPQLWQLSDPNLKVEEDLRLWTLKKQEGEKTKDTGGRLNRGGGGEGGVKKKQNPETCSETRCPRRHRSID